MPFELTIEQLRDARAILDKGYIPFVQDNHAGGYCAAGAIAKAVFGTAEPTISQLQDLLPCCWCCDEWHVLLERLNSAARHMYPKLKGAELPRPSGGYDQFNRMPIVFVNNHLGKEAVLACFDEAITRLELNVLYREESGRPPEPEPQPEPEPVLA